MWVADLPLGGGPRCGPTTTSPKMKTKPWSVSAASGVAVRPLPGEAEMVARVLPGEAQAVQEEAVLLLGGAVQEDNEVLVATRVHDDGWNVGGRGSP